MQRFFGVFTLLLFALPAYAGTQIVETTVYIPALWYRTKTSYGAGGGYSIFGLGASANLPLTAKLGAVFSYEMNMNSNNGAKIFSGMEFGASYRIWGERYEGYQNAREQIYIGSMDLVSVSAGFGQKNYNFESLLQRTNSVLYRSNVEGISGDAWVVCTAIGWSRLLENLTRVGLSIRSFVSMFDAKAASSLFGVRLSADWQFNLFGN